MTDHDALIKQLEGQISAKREEAERAAQAWRDAALDFLARRYKREVEKAILEDRPARAQELGRDGIAALKAELENLVGDVDVIVQEELGAPELWPHRSDAELLNPYRWGARLNRGPLDEPLRHAIGRVGPLLVERDLDDRDGPWKQDSNGWRWGYALDQDDEMEACLTAYGERLGELTSLLGKLDEAKTAREQSAARALWEQA